MILLVKMDTVGKVCETHWYTKQIVILLGLTPKEDLLKFNLDDIIVRFEQVDSYVIEVFKLHGNHLNQPLLRKIPWREAPETVTFTPGKLLMHTITHEFHHKGQIVAMVRQMGYVPPNTDVLGTED
jgi:uncharacterized damage-inducible protein DinB